MTSKEILQIIPADGWVAVYTLPDHPFYVICPLACWALVRENDDPTYVVGIDGTGKLAEIAEDADNFHEYILSSTIDDDSREGWFLAGHKYAGDLVKQGVREQL